MSEHLIYAYAFGYHHAVAAKYITDGAPDNGLTGELRAHYAQGFTRGVMDNINDKQAQALASRSTSTVDYRDIDARR